MAVFCAMSAFGALIVVRLLRGAVDEGTVGAAAAMGVGPTVPYWVGKAPSVEGTERRHVVVRLPVGSDLGTLAFDPPEHVARATVARARATTVRTLVAAGLMAPDADRTEPSTDVQASVEVTARGRRHAWIRRAVYAAAVPACTYVAALVAMDGLLRPERAWQVWLRLAVVMALTLVGLVAYGARRHRRSLATTGPTKRAVRWSIVGLVGGGLLAAGSFSLAFGSSATHRMTDYLYGEWISGRFVTVTPVVGSASDERKIWMALDEASFDRLAPNDLQSYPEQCGGADRCVQLTAWDELPPDGTEVLYLPRLGGVQPGLPDMSENAAGVAVLLSSVVLTLASAHTLLDAWRRRARTRRPASTPARPVPPSARSGAEQVLTAAE